MGILLLVVMCSYSILLLWQIKVSEEQCEKLIDQLNEARTDRNKYRALLELEDK